MQYRIIGTSDHRTCDCCGKPNLQLTIELQVTDDAGTPICVQRYGTVCAKHAATLPKAPRWMRRHDGSLTLSRENIVDVARQCARLRSI